MINLNFHYNSPSVSHESGLRTQVNKHEFKSKTVYRKFFAHRLVFKRYLGGFRSREETKSYYCNVCESLIACL